MRRALAPFCLALLLAGCGEETEIGIVTQVFPDGSLRRTARLDARDPTALLRVVDLLVRPDLAEPLREALKGAVESGGFRPLREGLADGALQEAAIELADLLDPDAPRWPSP
jgi:hypothetical protein